MKYFFIIVMLFISACSDEPKPSATKSGYNYYIEVCEYDGELPDSCKCRADILKKYLSDQKIILFAKATAYISSGQQDKGNAIIDKNPELVNALAKLLEESHTCDNQQLEN